jgi:predicted Rdx family selenoprotein
LRSAWLAQELLITFEKEMGEVALVPGSVRDRFAPQKHVGHSDR